MTLTEDDVFQAIVDLAQPVVSAEALRKYIDPAQHGTLRIHLGTLFRAERIMRRNGTEVAYWTSATAALAERKGYVSASVADPTALPSTVTELPKRISVSKVPRSSDIRAQLENRATSLPMAAPRSGKQFGALQSTATTGQLVYLLYQLHLLEPGRWFTDTDIEAISSRNYRKGEVRRQLNVLILPPLVRSEQPPYLERREQAFANRVYAAKTAPYCWRWADNYAHPFRADLAIQPVSKRYVDDLRERLASVPAPVIAGYGQQPAASQSQPVPEVDDDLVAKEASGTMVLQGALPTKRDYRKPDPEMSLTVNGNLVMHINGEPHTFTVANTKRLATLLVPHIESGLYDQALEDEDDDDEFEF